MKIINQTESEQPEIEQPEIIVPDCCIDEFSDSDESGSREIILPTRPKPAKAPSIRGTNIAPISNSESSSELELPVITILSSPSMKLPRDKPLKIDEAHTYFGNSTDFSSGNQESLIEISDYNSKRWKYVG